MEVLLLLVIIGLMVGFYTELTKKISNINRRIDDLHRVIREGLVAKPKEIIKEPIEKLQPKVVHEEIPPPVAEIKPSPVPLNEGILKKEEKVAEKITPFASFTEPSHIPQTPKQILPPKPTFFERNPDLEKFIGENLINKIGIAVLVLGIGFFVKYAIDQNWINEIGRVAIGILCGGILLGLAHYMRSKFKAFSSVLVGGGIAVLYFTIAIAFHQYHLFSQTGAFIIMVVITVFAVFLSIAYNRIELTVVSLIGGFSAPFMVSTGEGNYIVLFTYLIVLNIGMLILGYYKKWNLVNILSYVFTVAIYGGWLINKFMSENIPYNGALLFGTAFYFIFFLMNILHNITKNKEFKTVDFILLISNTFFYYGAGMYILHNVKSGEYQGIFTCVLGVFNFIFALFLYRREGIDRNLVFLLIGLVLSFISLAAPVQLHGNYITMFWAAETVLLLWLSQKSGIKLMKLSSIILVCLMLGSLIMDWVQLYYSGLPDKNSLEIVFNKGFITGVAVTASIFLNFYFLKNEGEEKLYGWFDLKVYRYILSIAGIVIIFAAMKLEINYQATTRISFFPATEIISGFYNLFFFTILNVWITRKNEPVITIILLSISVLLMIEYMIVYNPQVVLVRNDFLYGIQATRWNYFFHYFLALGALGLVASAFRLIRLKYGKENLISVLMMWFATLVIIYILSAELSHAVVMANYGAENLIHEAIDSSVKVGYPILWSISSFILMILGMRLKMRDLRIISLSLFFITLLKLFIYDIRNAPEGGKIAAFISLGIILLIVSFMYQKLKILILADAKQPKDEKKDE